MRRNSAHAANQVNPGGDIAPLVASAHLENAAVSVVQCEEVVGLQQHIAELGVGDSVGHSAADGLLGEHVVDAEVLAHVAHEVNRVDLFQPVGIVDEERRIVPGVEIQVSRQLRPDALQVLLQDFPGQKWAFFGLSSRIADEPGSATRNRDWRVAAFLHSHQHHYPEKVADVEAVGGRVETDVRGDPLTRQKFLKPGSEQLLAVIGYVNQASASEFVNYRVSGLSGHRHSESPP